MMQSDGSLFASLLESRELAAFDKEHSLRSRVHFRQAVLEASGVSRMHLVFFFLQVSQALKMRV